MPYVALTVQCGLWYLLRCIDMDSIAFFWIFLDWYFVEKANREFTVESVAIWFGKSLVCVCNGYVCALCVDCR